MRQGKRILPALLSLILVGLVFQSCYKDKFKIDQLDDPVWNPTWAVPLAKSTLKIEDILGKIDKEDVVIIDPATGLLALRYFDNVFSIEAGSLIILPDQSESGGGPVPPAIISTLESTGSVSYTMDQVVGFTTPSSEALDSIILKGGTLAYTISSGFPHGASSVTVSIPGMLDPSGVPYSRTFATLAPSGSLTESRDITGWTIDLTDGGTTTNAVRVTVTFNFTDSGASAGPTDLITMDLNLTSLDFRILFGDLKSQSITTGIDTVRLRIFENTVNGKITYDDPTVIAIFNNSYGAPVEINLPRFGGWSSLGGDIPILPEGIGSNLVQTGIFTIAAPNTSQIGMYIETRDSLTVTNSNIQFVFEGRPEKMIYDVDATTNPTGFIMQNFVLDTSKIRLDIIVDLPFVGKVEDFTRLDTINFDMFGLSDADSSLDSSGVPLFSSTDQVKELEIRLNVDNFFPVEASVQLYFYNYDSVTTVWTLVDSLFETGDDNMIIESANIDGSGRATGEIRKTTSIIIDKDKVQRLEDGESNKMVLKSLLETTNEGVGTIRIYQENYLTLWVGAKIEFEAPLDSTLISF